MKNSKILMVGAGGIGCELLKDLVMSGFENIEIIDLDTIDLSNLNRQFLFRHKHIGKSKSEVAAESALEFNPLTNIKAYQGNVKDEKFGVEFYKQFAIVLMALDNVEARRHVNRLCLAADVPVVESGTQGYLGQVQVIQKSKFECYDCTPKATKKTYAVCTINNTPSKPIHCIVWAKWKFKDYFTVTEQEKDDDENESQIKDDEYLQEEEQKLNKELSDNGYEKWLFRSLFNFEIIKRIRLQEITKKDLWAGRDPPKPLPLPWSESYSSPSSSSSSSSGQIKDQKVWSYEENVNMFLQSVENLKKEKELKGSIDWDKDHEEALNFVTAASNLRAQTFNIPLQSRFDVKAAAGNIIPAIATSNAIISGIIVLEAIKILNEQIDSCKYTYLLQNPSGSKRVIMGVDLEKPNPDCYVCSSHYLNVKIDVEQTTLKYFIDNVLKQSIGMIAPSLFIGSTLIYEYYDEMEDDEKEDMEKRSLKTLKELNIISGTLLMVEDEMQVLELELSVTHQEFKNNNDENQEEQSLNFIISGNTDDIIPTNMEDDEPNDVTNNNNNEDEGEDDTDSGIIIVRSSKRPSSVLNNNNNLQPPSKKQKLNNNVNEDDIIIL
eukprot:TRINITY_DN3172_c0_g1_i1.p1 TRINITY_DN3172_c0_g1~~TRINITY_DN3172_c0_g1_i1.p1  ORF type:complete len:606 (+),score=241.75 TRINITY_DN3172_c0_g1_i1:801-2618(+)